MLSKDGRPGVVEKFLRGFSLGWICLWVCYGD